MATVLHSKPKLLTISITTKKKKKNQYQMEHYCMLQALLTNKPDVKNKTESVTFFIVLLWTSKKYLVGM